MNISPKIPVEFVVVQSKRTKRGKTICRISFSSCSYPVYKKNVFMVFLRSNVSASLLDGYGTTPKELAFFNARQQGGDISAAAVEDQVSGVSHFASL